MRPLDERKGPIGRKTQKEGRNVANIDHRKNRGVLRTRSFKRGGYTRVQNQRGKDIE